MHDNELLLDLTGDTNLLWTLQEQVDQLHDDGHLDIEGSKAGPLRTVLLVLAANGGDPLVDEDLPPLRRHAGDAAMRRALDALEEFRASLRSATLVA